MAVKRAQMEGIPVLLGSATPSLETWRNAERGRYTRLAMPTRVGGRPMPAVEIIDLRHEKAPSGGLSESLRQAMIQALEAGGQVILLLNRRGFHTFVLCPRCGHVVKCHACDVAATYHKERHILICHTCDAERACPPACPHCGAPSLHYGGIGTERLEREIQLAFPDVVARRMDSDTMRSPGSHEQVLAAFHAGEVQILLGTQMIAKGLDFPNVTLVGVVNADIGAAPARLPRRRADLSARGAGGRTHRTGRQARPGARADLLAGPSRDPLGRTARLSTASSQTELPERERYGVPPYGRLVRLIARGAGGIGRLRLHEGSGGSVPLGRRSLGPHPGARPGPHPQDPQPLSVPPPVALPKLQAPPVVSVHRARPAPAASWHRAGHRRRPDHHAVIDCIGRSSSNGISRIFPKILKFGLQHRAIGVSFQPFVHTQDS